MQLKQTMTLLLHRMTMRLPSQLQRMMITRLPLLMHMQHLQLQHQLLPKPYQRIQVMQLIRYLRFVLQPRSAIYL
jgi:hypothetical protein